VSEKKAIRGERVALPEKVSSKSNSLEPNPPRPFTLHSSFSPTPRFVHIPHDMSDSKAEKDNLIDYRHVKCSSWNLPNTFFLLRKLLSLVCLSRLLTLGNEKRELGWLAGGMRSAKYVCQIIVCR
jgi:hypothetical protein